MKYIIIIVIKKLYNVMSVKKYCIIRVIWQFFNYHVLVSKTTFLHAPNKQTLFRWNSSDWHLRILHQMHKKYVLILQNPIYFYPIRFLKAWKDDLLKFQLLTMYVHYIPIFMKQRKKDSKRHRNCICKSHFFSKIKNCQNLIKQPKIKYRIHCK